MQRKYIGLIAGILIILVVALSMVIISGLFVSSVTNVNVVNNTYSEDGVSFNVPPNWQVSKIVDGSTTNIDIINNAIVDGPIANIDVTNNTDSHPNSDNLQITVDISPIPKGMSNQYVINMIQNQGDYQKISNNTTTVDGNIAYENTYIVKDSNRFDQTMKEQQINFIKNGSIYGLTFDAPQNTFDSEISNFNITLNSFKIL